MYTPVNPSFTIYKWDVEGCTLHGHISTMQYTIAIFTAVKHTHTKIRLKSVICFLSFAENVNCGCKLELPQHCMESHQSGAFNFKIYTKKY